MSTEFLTIKDLMSRYQVTKATIHNWRNSGRLPQGMKIARTRRWKLSEIESWEKTAKEVNN